MPSFGYGGEAAAAEHAGRVGLVVAEQGGGRRAAGPRGGLEAVAAEPGVVDHDGVAARSSASAGTSSSRPDQLHELRNHSVGSTCSGAASGPAFSTVIRARTSVGDALA